MGIYIDAFGDKNAKVSVEKAINLINAAEDLSNTERRKLLADFAATSGKEVKGPDFEALTADEPGTKGDGDV